MEFSQTASNEDTGRNRNRLRCTRVLSHRGTFINTLYLYWRTFSEQKRFFTIFHHFGKFSNSIWKTWTMYDCRTDSNVILFMVFASGFDSLQDYYTRVYTQYRTAHTCNVLLESVDSFVLSPNKVKLGHTHIYTPLPRKNKKKLKLPIWESKPDSVLYLL